MKNAATVQDYQELGNFLVEQFDFIHQKFDAIDKRFDLIDKRFEAVDKRFDLLEDRVNSLPTREYVDKKFAETHNLIMKNSLRVDALVDVLHAKQVINDNDKKLVNRYKNI